MRSFSKTSKTSSANPAITVAPVARPLIGRNEAAEQAGNAAQIAHDFSRVPVHSPQSQKDAVHRIAEQGVKGGGAALPYLAEIQRSFGRHDVSGVRAHGDSRASAAARAIGARAYATGGNVAFGGSPDFRTAAHEAAHVVQQRGAVRLPENAGRKGDAYERHADAVADLVVQGRSSEALLDQMAPAGSRSLRMQPRVVQRLPLTDFGEFKTTKYNSIGPPGSEYGLDVVLEFDPDRTKVDAKKIGLTQAVRSDLAGVAANPFPVDRNRRVSGSGPGAGWEIDRSGSGNYGNPLYATGAPGPTDKLSDTATESGWGQHGWNYKDATGTPQHQSAILIDTPTLPNRGKNSGQQFETAALAVEGTQAGTYMGSVSWGWSVDAAGKFTKNPVTLKSKGDPSAGFQAAAAQWNKTSVGGTVKTIADPTNVYNADNRSVAFTVAKDTEVVVTDGFWVTDDNTFDEATVKNGEKAGRSGRFKVNDLQESGGTPVVQLPIPQGAQRPGGNQPPQGAQHSGSSGLPGWAIGLMIGGGAALLGGVIGLGVFLSSHHP